ncbi:MAG: SAM-dependent methyltransferase [Candidatus Mesenet longicola]|uniref:SAM-dependent methyltransferase n=1 Tax=Candidatus Mesenet longicola TaxID=1892558 RepID=A0A8J3HPM7_9RICK|nr:MAG: SAM-dependent methyltransferase [Candidatus Mesenet longicola]GHM59526.1 MAG: SAM-dependent methyltransferase [Candidatus Mesenet longicola]
MIFDRNLYEKHRDRAACLDVECDFLFNKIIDIIFEKLSVFLNQDDSLLHLGCRNDKLVDLLQSSNFSFKEKLLQCDISYNTISKVRYGRKVVLDEEFLPFMEQTFNIVMSTMSLHCVNNLPSVLLRINDVLKKDGVFIGTVFGPQTLNELRYSILSIESKSGVVTSRVIPFIRAVDVTNLLKQSRFVNSVLDVHTITVKYKSVLDLFHDLRSMGETNMLYTRNKSFLSKSLITEIEKFYIDNFVQDDHYIPATFEMIIMQGTKLK